VAAKRRQAGEPTKITGQDMGETAESELVKDPPTQQEPNYPEQEKEHLGDAEKGTGIYASKEDQPETLERMVHQGKYDCVCSLCGWSLNKAVAQVSKSKGRK
jgi:hypothetical protein